MLPDRVSNPGPLTYESGALPIALRGPAILDSSFFFKAKSAILYSYLCGTLCWVLRTHCMSG